MTEYIEREAAYNAIRERNLLDSALPLKWGQKLYLRTKKLIPARKSKEYYYRKEKGGFLPHG